MDAGNGNGLSPWKSNGSKFLEGNGRKTGMGVDWESEWEWLIGMRPN